MSGFRVKEGNVWGFQPYYLVAVKNALEKALEEIGLSNDCLATLVAVDWPTDSAPVGCGLPLKREFASGLFTGFDVAVEQALANDPARHVFYGDALRMSEKPERLRRSAVKVASVSALAPYHEAHELHAVAGSPQKIDEWYVVPILQVPLTTVERAPAVLLPTGPGALSAPGSIVHALLGQVAAEASRELLQPHPGRSMSGGLLKPAELAVRAATSFMYAPGLAIGADYRGTDLFESLNLISSTLYERSEGVGRVLLATEDDPRLTLQVRFREPVPMRDPAWARKALQMASGDLALVSDTNGLLGLGAVDTAAGGAADDLFEVSFLGHHDWQLQWGDAVLLRSTYGRPHLPRPSLTDRRLVENLRRVIAGIDEADAERAVGLFRHAQSLGHGSMIVVAEDAASEALRLRGQATPIDPAPLTPSLLERVSAIDGSILIDPTGECHAIGVILDGPASERCLPSRGSRYNSAVRYVGDGRQNRLAFVVSDDGGADVLPLLRPRVPVADIERALDELEQADVEGHNAPKKWLVDHRFYLSQDQCDRANAAMARLEALVLAVPQRIWWAPGTFAPHPEMDESYLM